MNKPIVMSLEYWRRYLQRRLGLIEDTLGKKAEEYARGNDRMHNFNRAMVLGEVKTREEAISGMALKHFTSIADLRDDIANGTLPTKAMVEEKFGDAINYLLLEEASFLHTIDTQNGFNPEPPQAQYPPYSDKSPKAVSACDVGLWQKRKEELLSENYMAEHNLVMKEIHQSEDGPEALI